jgi:hypothetical protein
MTAVVRQLRRTTTPDAPASQAEPQDYCQCGRGPVIGVVITYADRVIFWPLRNPKASWSDYAADVRCIDCLADTSMDVANGVVEEQMREMARERAAEMDALMRANAMRREAGLPIVPAIVPEDCDEWPTGGQR